MFALRKLLYKPKVGKVGLWMYRVDLLLLVVLLVLSTTTSTYFLLLVVVLTSTKLNILNINK